jgi:hypothetical protein
VLDVWTDLADVDINICHDVDFDLLFFTINAVILVSQLFS